MDWLRSAGPWAVDGEREREYELVPFEGKDPPGVKIDKKARGAAVVLAAVSLSVRGSAGVLRPWFEAAVDGGAWKDNALSLARTYAMARG